MMKLSNKKFMVIGNPVDHSLSPIMHQANFTKLGLDCTYEKVCVEDISKIRDLVVQKDISGFNVTLPFKEAIVPFLDHISLPSGISAVNTVDVQKDGGKTRLIGYNTDIYGILTDFFEKGISLKDKKVLILGYGGLGKTLASVFRKSGTADIFAGKHQFMARRLYIKEVKVANRTMKPGVDIECKPEEMMQLFQNFDVVVNTLKIGVLDAPEVACKLPSSFSGVLYDCTPKSSSLVLMAQELSSCKAFNGLGMLVHQGAKSFEIWTEMQANVAVMKAAVEESLES